MAAACVTLDQERGQPQSQALNTLEEVLSWTVAKDQLFYPEDQNSENYSRPTGLRTKPYTLVCHDYKGNYLEDRYLQGGKKKDGYYFCQWNSTDIFVYFSHHFVTVPPLVWRRAAHKHNTMVLGTVITEWDSGATLWSTALASKNILDQLVSSLVAICKYHGFDGWLVNVENKIEESQVAALREFLLLLSEKSHQQLPGSMILWYDSVICSGHLMWQNQLNEENSMFFDACDGIFLNYCWTDEKLEASQKMALQKNRPYDVFVGIDVFGRGCPGGGGFNTDVALKKARNYDLSVAIFAPAWVMEEHGATYFEVNDCRFWASLSDLCCFKDPSGLPLSSTFCQGHGEAFFCSGQIVADKPWYNLSLQQQQPQRTHAVEAKDLDLQATQPNLGTCLSMAYQGGCSIELPACLCTSKQAINWRLFRVRTKLDETLYCSYTYACKNNSIMPCDIELVLNFGSELQQYQIILGSAARAVDTPDPIILCHASEQADEPSFEKPRTITVISYVHPLTELEPLRSSLWFYGLQENGENQNHTSWRTRHFRVEKTKLMLSSNTAEEVTMFIDVRLHPYSEPAAPSDQTDLSNKDSTFEPDSEGTSILLGHLQVFQEEDLKLLAPKIMNIKLEKLPTKNMFSFTASTKTKSSTDSEDVSVVPAFVSESLYIVQWNVESQTAVDYFNVYLSTGETPCLIGQTATTSFVTPITTEFVHDAKVTVTVQPVLSATSLPVVLSKCFSHVIPFPDKL